jgi:hypothetical protein
LFYCYECAKPPRHEPQGRPGSFVTMAMRMKAAELRKDCAVARNEILMRGPNVLAVAQINNRLEQLEKGMGVEPEKKFDIFPV